MKNIFICDGCSNKALCCRDFKTTFIGKDISEKHKKLEGRGPVYNVIPIENKRLPLYGWELERIRECSDNDFKYSPRTVIYDIKSDKMLALLWNIDHDDCPFLDDDKACKVYDARMMHCRIFPLVIPTSGNSLQVGYSSICPNIVDPGLVGSVSEKDYVRALYDSYGEAFLWSIQRKVMLSWFKRLIRVVTDNGLIEPVKDTPVQWVVKKMGKDGCMGLLEHLKSIDDKIGYDIDLMVKKFYELEDAREYVAGLGIR